MRRKRGKRKRKNWKEKLEDKEEMLQRRKRGRRI